MTDLVSLAMSGLAIGAFLIGVSKTALPGAGTLSMTIFAPVLPARESTAAILPLLITGDVIAVWIYRHEANFKALRRLIPTVIVGMVVGAFFLYYSNDLV